MGDFWSKHYGVNIACDHKFSCENVDYKQEWIGTLFTPGAIFPDIEKLQGNVVADSGSNKVGRNGPCQEVFR